MEENKIVHTKPLNIVFWWNIPCEGIINVFLEVSKINNGDTKIITGYLSSSRKDMGWEDKGKLSENHILLKDSDYGSKDLELLEEYKNYIHVIGGIVHPPYVKNLLQAAISKNIVFFNMSEAYCNMDFSWKRSFKNLYYQFIYPFKHKPIAQKSLGVFSLSGGNASELKKFIDSGWPKHKVIPFGYFTDEKLFQPKDNTGHKIQLLCPGLIEKYKGVDLLIEACHLLNQKGFSNFNLHITGKGSEKPHVELLINKYKLNDLVVLHGAMPFESYQELYQKIDVLIAPGRAEPWGIRINEAIQSGLAVIVSDGLGASEMILQSKGGVVFKTENVADLTLKMEELLGDLQALAKAKENNLAFRAKIHPKQKAFDLLRILENFTA